MPAFKAVLLPSILVVLGIASGLNSISLVKAGEVWDSFYRHTYSRAEHPGYFWFHVSARMVSCFGLLFLAACLLFKFNPITA